jgi:glycosyltransferase involved in cell wall biosynthesis
MTEPDLASAHYVVVGTGPSLEELRELAADLGVDNRVHFVGLVTDEDRDGWLAQATVSVVPSVALEGYGLSVLESLAVGTPVIASRLGGLIDAAAMSPFVTLVAPSVTAEWADALLDVFANRPDPVDVQRSVEQCTWDRVAHLTSSIYRELVTGEASNRQQIVVIDHTAKRSGGELAMVRTVTQFQHDARWGVHVVLFEEGEIESDLARHGISYDVMALPARTRNRRKDELTKGILTSLIDSATFVVRLRRHLRALSPTVVHSNSLKSYVLGSVASVGAPWRMVTHVRDVWSPPYLSEMTSRLLRALLYLRSDAVIANSSITARASLPSAVVIPSPVDPSMYAVTAPTPSSVTRIAIIGRLAPWKGQDLFLDALDLLSDVPHQGFIVGDALFGESAYRANLEERVATMNGRVVMLGAVSDVAGVLQDCDVVVLGSRSPEPFGNVVTEAMAAGRIVVVPRQGGVLDFIEDRRNGFFYEPNSEQSLADVLRAVATGRVDRAAVASAARLTASTFSAPAVAERVRRLYELVVE